jgi:hypothetical protein
MDGNGIAYTLWPGDIDFQKTSLRRSAVHAIQLIGKVKSTTAQTITATHYVDGVSTGTVLEPSPVISQNKAGYRIFRAYFPVIGQPEIGTYHSTKFTITTIDENRGFEPLLLSYKWSDEGEVTS